MKTETKMLAAGGVGALVAVTIGATLLLSGAAGPQTWEAEGGEIGDAVYVSFVANQEFTPHSDEQTLEDAQEVCREFHAGESGSTLAERAKSSSDWGYETAVLAGAVHWYCTEYKEELP